MLVIESFHLFYAFHWVVQEYKNKAAFFPK